MPPAVVNSCLARLPPRGGTRLRRHSCAFVVLFPGVGKAAARLPPDIHLLRAGPAICATMTPHRRRVRSTRLASKGPFWPATPGWLAAPSKARFPISPSADNLNNDIENRRREPGCPLRAGRASPEPSLARPGSPVRDACRPRHRADPDLADSGRGRQRRLSVLGRLGGVGDLRRHHRRSGRADRTRRRRLRAADGQQQRLSRDLRDGAATGRPGAARDPDHHLVPVPVRPRRETVGAAARLHPDGGRDRADADSGVLVLSRPRQPLGRATFLAVGYLARSRPAPVSGRARPSARRGSSRYPPSRSGTVASRPSRRALPIR